MDFFTHPCYATMRNMNRMVGIWPYQDRWKNIICRTFSLIMLAIHLSGEIIFLLLSIRGNQNLTETMMTVLSALYCVSKYINSILQMKTMMKLLERMKDNQNIFISGDEKQIMEAHAQKGKSIVRGYSIGNYVTILLILCEPAVEYVKHSIFPTNETLIHEYPTPTDFYFIDMQKNFYPIWGFQSVCVIILLTVAVASENMFFTFSQHARALFIIVQHQFTNLPTRDNLEMERNNYKNYKEVEDIQYDYYRMCIRNHKRAIEYAGLLEFMFVWCFGLLIVLCVPAVSFALFQLITQSYTTQQIIQLIMFNAVQLLHLFFNCYLSQQLIDESDNIYKYISKSEWYRMPLNTQKLLILVMLRSQKPFSIKAGKMVTLSMETYGTMVKTAVSYLTVLMALQ